MSYKTAVSVMISITVVSIACTQTTPATPSPVPAFTSSAQASLGAHAVSGGPFEMLNVTVRPGGGSATTDGQFYADEGGVYQVPAGKISFWVEYKPVNGNPRVVIDWGIAGVENDFDGCGACGSGISASYPTGRFTVTLTLKGAIGPDAVRTFQLDTTDPNASL
ncbi:MAG: hypothetical protein ABIR28_14785 [Vicinamibacteria bacterium]